MEAGLLQDLNIGLNSLSARWVEEQFWVYRRGFHVRAENLKGSQWLIFEWLEHAASVWLNGAEIGRHANSHRRAVFDVTGRLREGENLLIVVVESGLHHAHDVPVDGYAFDRYAQITRRPLLRKAQYQCGWDWNPRLMNVGILGDVSLECSDVPVIHEVSITANLDQALQNATLLCRVFLRHPAPCISVPVSLSLAVPESGRETSQEVTLSAASSAVTCHALSLDLPRPVLWWPAGLGEQKLYDVRVELKAGRDKVTLDRQVGFRSIEVGQSPHPDGGRYFVMRVNNQPVFCKGANWVPPDLLPSRVSAKHYEELVRAAAAANFNTLRVWGGGVFAPEPFLDACDRHGILIWHDFLFACARYPADDPAFTAEVEAEVREAVRRMSHHPSLAVWCGNNEVEWGDREWGYAHRRPIWPHHALFHHHIPATLAEEDPSRFYWPSSPWSPDFAAPNDPSTGDQHPWGVSILNPGPADFHLYRTYTDRFPNEGGVLGAALPATLQAFLPEDQQHLLSLSWVHHDNPIAYRASQEGCRGRTYETFRYWTGLDPLTLAMEEYALLSGLLQAEGLTEYVVNYRRRKFSSASAIFWMYNDSWPATHSWTIVDYCLRRRVSYHPVRRAFQPVSVVTVDEGERIVWYGVNDTLQEWTGTLRHGVFFLKGGYAHDAEVRVSIPANASAPLAALPKTVWEEAGIHRSGAFGVLLADRQIVAYHRLFLHPFHELELVPATVDVKRLASEASFRCETFAWGVCLDTTGSHEYADNCFDLLPGLRYTVPWPGSAGEPQVAWIGSNALLQARLREKLHGVQEGAELRTNE